MGGGPAGPVERGEHDYAFWEKRVDALMVLLSSPQRQLIRVDELRRAIESLGPDVYDRLSYYERWIAAISRLMVEKGVLGGAEIDARIADLRRRGVGKT
ncbi:MAG: nitrile hydratase subunit beta [Alphaproteobacteria bacterium]|nr:nitrile hydratase subunit beta [Alphaproteobacteria bacterium]